MDTDFVNNLLVCDLEGENLEVFMRFVGKTIRSITFDGDYLRLMFESDRVLTITDHGQSCCENRYMTTDDNLADFVGAGLLNIAIKELPIPLSQYGQDSLGEHEVVFLEVVTTKGSFVITNHNEHNGYYGGFSMRLEDKEQGA